MAGSVAHLPHDPKNGDGLPPADLYKLSVEEYRFQAQFNWSRTQYLLAFNAAILTAAAAVASQPGRSAALVFVLGVAAALLSITAVRTQHGYYRAARDRMCRVEKAIGVPEDHRTDTTATLGKRSRAVSVNQIVYLLLASMAIANVVGCTIIVVSR
jgi:hypothetical protein